MINIIVLVLLGAVLLLQLVLLLRSKAAAAPVGVMVQLDQLDRSTRELQSSINRLEGVVATFATQIQGMAQATAASLESMHSVVDEKLAQVAADSRAGRGELAEALVGLRGELTAAVGNLAAESPKSRDALMESAAMFEKRIQERFEALTAANQETLGSLKADMGTQLTAMSTALREQLDGNGNQIRNQLSMIQESVAQHMAGLAQGNQQSADQLRNALNERLAAIQTDNTAKLEEMRRTVDEKLHATLEQRLGQSFQLVSERLELVQRGLGEMQALAIGVGDLKRVLSNVKTRGTWGEVQLGAIIEQILTPEQYAKNIATRPSSNERVEFALRLPGKQDDHPVWLPIDAKFPLEDYQRLLDAHESADEDGIRSFAKALEDRVRMEAKTIRDKYVFPPHTTDFAILYLPTEGLFAEVLRRPGLSEAMQRDYRVVIAGPTNLAAILNSLQMGFKTLAIERRSSEVWTLLGAVKSEFGKFGEVVAATQKKLEAATNQFSEVSVRTRAIQRRLRNVEELPTTEAAVVLPLLDPGAAAADSVAEV